MSLDILQDDYLIRTPRGIVGIYVPSVLYAVGDAFSIVGPLGQVTIKLGRNREDELVALCAVGGALLGSPDEATAVNSLLLDEKWSRTASYLSTVASSCGDLLRRQRAIAEAGIVIVGCGGIGSLAAVLMAGAGVSSLTIVDGDVVERSNLNRQLFWRQVDVGRRKVDVLKEVLAQRHPDLIVETRYENIQKGQLGELIADRDGLIFCADQPITLVEEVSTVASQHPSVPCVSAGYTFSSAVVVLHGNCRWSRRYSPSWQPFRKGIMPSHGPVNAEVAGSATGMLIRALPDRFGRRRRFMRTWTPGAT